MISYSHILVDYSKLVVDFLSNLLSTRVFNKPIESFLKYAPDHKAVRMILVSWCLSLAPTEHTCSVTRKGKSKEHLTRRRRQVSFRRWKTWAFSRQQERLGGFWMRIAIISVSSTCSCTTGSAFGWRGNDLSASGVGE